MIDRVAGVGRPPASILVFWGVALLTMIFGHYQISGRLNLPYKGLTILVCLLAPLSPGFLSLFRKRQILYLIVFEAVLILGCLAGYTGSPSDLLSVGSQPVIFLRVFPFLLCGYTLALHPRFERLYLSALLTAFALLTLPDAILLFRGTTSGIVRERFLIEAYDQASAQALVAAMVNVSVLGLLLALAGVRLYDYRHKMGRFVVAIPQAILAVRDGRLHGCFCSACLVYGCRNFGRARPDAAVPFFAAIDSHHRGSGQLVCTATGGWADGRFTGKDQSADRGTTKHCRRTRWRRRK